MSPSKRAFEKDKSRGLFSEFYGILTNLINIGSTNHNNFLVIFVGIALEPPILKIMVIGL